MGAFLTISCCSLIEKNFAGFYQNGTCSRWKVYSFKPSNKITLKSQCPELTVLCTSLRLGLGKGTHLGTPPRVEGHGKYYLYALLHIPAP